MTRITVESNKREEGWWVRDPNNEPPYDEVGPYPTKMEAQEAAAGLTRFYMAESKKK